MNKKKNTGIENELASATKHKLKLRDLCESMLKWTNFLCQIKDKFHLEVAFFSDIKDSPNFSQESLRKGQCITNSTFNISGAKNRDTSQEVTSYVSPLRKPVEEE